MNQQVFDELYQRALCEEDSEAAVELALYYCRNDQHEDALFWIKEAVLKKNPQAVYLLGTFYEAGVGVEENPIKAFELFASATALGCIPAIYKFGYYLFYGVVKENQQEGFYYIELAAKQGYADAENEIAALYMDGDYVEQNIELALCWWERAAKHGSYVAQFNLGLTSFIGEVVTKDYVRALELFHLSAIHGYADAEHAIGVMYLNGLGVEENKEIALDWLLKALEHDCHHEDAMNLLYQVHLRQDVGRQDVFEKFTQCLNIAAQEGNTKAVNILNSSFF